MLFKLLYMYIFGVVDVTIEGFFVERFMNICKMEDIVLWNLNIEKGTILQAKVAKSDFKKMRHIAKKTSCKITLNEKSGLPFVLKKYKKRKIFAIAVLVIAIFCFLITRFIWNIEVQGNEKISKEEILSDLAKFGIQEGKLKANLNLEEINNQIRLSRDDLAWLGIDIKGTNVIVTVVEATQEPQILDKNMPSNIIADKSGTISKMIVRNGTARVKVGDEVVVR